MVLADVGPLTQCKLVAQRGQVSMLVEGTRWPQVGQLNQ